VAAGTPYQIASGTGLGANPVLTVATATQSGDAVFLYFNTSGVPSAISDSKGNTYLQVFADSANGVCMYAATYKGSPGIPTAALTTSDTISITTAATGQTILAAGCSGLAPQAAAVTNPTGLAAAIHGTSTASSMTITPAAAGQMVIFGQAWAGNAVSITYTGGFTKIADAGLASNGVSMGYQLAPSAASLTCSATLGASIGWYDGAASFAIAVQASAPALPGPPALRHPAVQAPSRGPLQAKADTTGPPLAAGMAPWSFINGQVTGAVTSRVYTVPANQSPTQPGDTLLITVQLASAAMTVSSLTDSAGNIYTLDGSWTTNSPQMFCYRSPGTTGGSGGGPTAALAPGATLTLATSATNAAALLSGFCVPGAAWGAADFIGTVVNATATATVTSSVTPGANGDLAIITQINQSSAPPVLVSGPWYAQCIPSGGAGSNTITWSYQALGAGTSGVAQSYTSSWAVSGSTRLLGWSFAPKVLANGYEGGTSGNNLATVLAVSGEKAWDSVLIGSGAVAQYDNAHAHNGTLSAQISTSATTASAYAGWSTALGGSQQQLWARFYVYMTAYPTVNSRICTFYNSSSFVAASVNGFLRINSGGKLALCDSGSTQRWISAANLPLNQWCRVEVYCLGDAASGQLEARLWTSNPEASAATPDDGSGPLSAMPTTGSIGSVSFGVGAGGPNAGPYWIDDAAISTGTWLGPTAPPSAVPVALADAAAAIEDVTSVPVQVAVPLADAAAAADTATVALPYQVGTYTGSGTATSRTVPVTTATGAGDTLFLLAESNSGTGTLTAVTDSKGNVYTLDGSNATSPQFYSWRSPGATGGPGGTPTVALTTSDTITITTGAQNITWGALAFALPAGSAGALDNVTAVTHIATATSYSPSGTPAANGELALVLSTGQGAAGALTYADPLNPGPYFTAGAGGNYTAVGWSGLGTGTSGAAQTFTITTAVTGTASWLVYFFSPYSVTTPVSLADAGGAADAIAISAQVPLADTAGAADAIAISAAVPVADQAAAIDAITAVVTAAISYADQAGAADAIALTAAVPLSDAAGAAESLAITVTLPLAEAAGAADAVAVSAAVPVADRAAAVESLPQSPVSLSQADAAGAAESLAVAATLLLADQAAAVDALVVTQPPTVPTQVATGLTSGSGTSRTATVSQITSAGDTLLALVSSQATSCTVSTLTDSKGNVYTLDRSYTGSIPLIFCFRSPGATGGSGGGPTAALAVGDTVTATSTAATGNVEIQLIDVPGVGAADQIGTLTNSVAATQSVSATPAQNGETCVVLQVNANSGGTPTVGSPFTLIATYHTGVNVYNTASYQQLGAGAGGGAAQSYSATTPVSSGWSAMMYTFFPLGAQQAEAAGAIESLSVAAAVPLPDPDQAAAVEQFAGVPPATVLPRCHRSGDSGATTTTAIAPNYASMTNSGEGLAGTTPVPGDLVILVVHAHLANLTISQTADTAGGHAWQFLNGSAGDNNGGTVGMTSMVLYRYWTGAESSPAWTVSTACRVAFSTMAFGPTTAGQNINIDSVVGMVTDQGATTHNPPAVAAAVGGELSLVLGTATGGAGGTNPITYANGAWTILGARNNTGAGGSGPSSQSFGTFIGFQAGQGPGTITPDAWTIEGSASATGNTNVNFYHFLLAAAPVPAITLTNSLDGTNNAAITPANSGPGPLGTSTNFQAVQAGGNGSVTYDTTKAAFSGSSANIVNGTTSGYSYMGWGQQFGVTPPLGGPAANQQLWFRFYYLQTAAPTSNQRTFQISLQGDPVFDIAQSAIFLRITGLTNKWAIIDAAGTVVFTSTGSIPNNTWCRFEGTVIGDPANGGIQVSFYTSALATATAAETFTALTGQATGGYMGFIEFGGGVSATSLNYWIDEAGVSNVGPLGAVVPVYDNAAAVDSLAVSLTIAEADTAGAADVIAIPAKTLPAADAAAATEALAVTVTLPLAEVAAGADTIALTAKSLPVSEVAAGADQLAVSAALAYADAAGAAETFAVTIAVPLAEQAGAADTIAVPAKTIPLAEQAGAADAPAIAATLPLSDAAGAAEVLAVSVPVPVADTAAASDQLSVSVPVPVAEAAGAVESLAVAVTLALPDQAGAAEAITLPAETLPLPDAAGAAETLTVAVTLQLADTAGATDALSVTFTGASPALAETAGAVESAAISVTAPLAEQAGGADAFQVAGTGNPSFPDAGGAADVLSVFISAQPVALADTAAAAEALALTGIAFALADNAGATDQQVVTATTPLTEAAGATEALVVSGISAAISLAETAGAAETQAISAAVPLADSAGAADALSVTAAAVIPFPDQAGATESLAITDVTTAIGDVAGAVDALSVSVTFSYADQAGAADRVTSPASVPLAESAGAAESLALTETAAPAYPERAAAVDQFAVSVAVPVADRAGAADIGRATSIAALAIDYAAATESLSVVVTAAIPLAEAAGAAEQFSVAMGIPFSDQAGAADALVGALVTPLVIPRGFRSGDSGTTSTGVITPNFTALTNAGQGVAGTQPQPGDLVIIIGQLHLSNLTASQTTDNANNWTFLSTGDNNGGAVGMSTFVAYRWWTGGEAANSGITFTASSTCRVSFTTMAFAPAVAGQIINVDFVTAMVRDQGATTHTPPSVTASGPGETSVVLMGATGTSGTNPLTWSDGAWTLQGYRSNVGDGTVGQNGSTFGTAIGWMLSQGPGTVAPDPWTVEGSASPTGNTNVNMYHLMLTAAPVAQITLTNSFEGGTNNADITTANSGPGPSGQDEAFDFVQASASGTSVTYDSTKAAFGKMSANMVTGTTNSQAWAEWGNSLGGPASNKTLYFRFYYYQSAIPSSNQRTFQISQQQSGASGLANCAIFIRIITFTSKWAIIDATGTVVYTSTGTVPTGQWCRFEGSVTGDSATGQITVRCYSTARPDASAEVASLSNQNTGGPMGFVEFGGPVNATSLNYNVDEVGVSNVTWLGPVTACSDSAGAADALSVSKTIALADAGATTDSMAVTVPVALADQAGAADAFTSSFQKTLTDVAAAADARALTMPYMIAGKTDASPALPTETVPVTVATKAGDTLVAICLCPTTTYTLGGFTDSQGNIYTLDHYVTTLPTTYCFISPGATGGPGGGLTRALGTSDTVSSTGGHWSAPSGGPAATILVMDVPGVSALDKSITPANGTDSVHGMTVAGAPTSDKETAIAWFTFSYSASSIQCNINAPFAPCGAEAFVGIPPVYNGINGAYDQLGTGTAGAGVTATAFTLTQTGNWNAGLLFFYGSGVAAQSDAAGAVEQLSVAVSASLPDQAAAAETASYVNIVTVNSSFEAGPPGATITAAGSGTGTGGDTAWDLVTTGSGATTAYDTTHLHTGALAGEFGTGATAALANVSWSAAIGGPSANPQGWFRVYLYLTALPTANTRVVTLAGTAPATSVRAFVRVNNGGKLCLCDSAGGQVWISTSPLPTSTWMRIEGWVLGDPLIGQAQVRLWTANPESTGTPDDSYTSPATLNTSGPVGGITFGIAQSSQASVGPYWLDDAGFSTVTWLGPVIPTLPTVDDRAAAADSFVSQLGTPTFEADRAAAADAFAHIISAQPITVADTAGAADQVSHVISGLSPAVADLAAAADQLTVSAAVPVADVAGTTEYITLLIGTAIGLSDAAAATDIDAGVQAFIQLTDTGAVAEQPTLAETRPIAETAAGADALLVTPAQIHGWAEYAGAAEVLRSPAAVPLPERAAAAETLAVVKLTTPLLTDPAGAAEGLIVARLSSLAEAAAATEALTAVPATAKQLADTAAAADKAAVQAAVPLPEPAAAAERAALPAKTLPAADAAGAAEALKRSTVHFKAANIVARASMYARGARITRADALWDIYIAAAMKAIAIEEAIEEDLIAGGKGANYGVDYAALYAAQLEAFDAYHDYEDAKEAIPYGSI